jgi:hypothetical protein
MTYEEIRKSIVGQKIVGISECEYDAGGEWLTNMSGVTLTLENGVELDTLGEPLGVCFKKVVEEKEEK